MHEDFTRQVRKKSINSNLSKSIILSYISLGHPYGSHDILSSRSERRKVKDEIAREEKMIKNVAQINTEQETALFEYKSDTSGLKIIHKLNLLKSVDDQDLINWKICFEEVARICNWSEEVQQEVLTQIVDINIQYQIGTTGS
ncbi:hypothetical protein DMUE_4840, partial [Dictyocoela muelleri]